MRSAVDFEDKGYFLVLSKSGGFTIQPWIGFPSNES